MPKIHRFIILNFRIEKGEQTVLDTEIVHQIKDVLKLKVGEKIAVGDGAGKLAEGEILDFKNKQILLNISQILVAPKNTRTVHIYCSVLKKDSLEWLVEKAVECGADSIVPLLSKRVVKTDFNRARLEKIIKEAAEQSERFFLPKLSTPVSLEEALKNAPGKKIFFDKTGRSLENFFVRADCLSVFIGPEGGWNEYELELAEKSGIETISLGENILRAETAAAIAVYLAKNIF